RPVLALIIQHKANRSVAYFRGKLVRRFAHRAPSYSGVGASGKPGAVQHAQSLLFRVRERLVHRRTGLPAKNGWVLASTIDWLQPSKSATHCSKSISNQLLSSRL
ncbi:MAG: hypothetical protein RIE06_33720, partial [Roseibium album]|uniref:hypothetical protein n=1 Tax=Roseibium album TaxID=311410 RepID=UPI0032EAA163